MEHLHTHGLEIVYNVFTEDLLKYDFNKYVFVHLDDSNQSRKYTFKEISSNFS